MLSLIVTLVLAASLVWLGYYVIKQYRAADGAFWERLLSGFKDSATVLVAGATYVGGAAINLVGKAADAASAPEVTEVVRTQIPAEYAGYGLMALAFLIFVARLRTL